MPGLVEGHSHLLLHPYNETSWNDQVLRESIAYRVARATVSARDTLMAGITTVRDLGTEGAGYADVGLKQAIEDGVIPGPRMLVSGPAMVATGTLWAEGLRPRDRGAAGRRGSRRHRRRDPRGAPPDRPRHRLREGVRRLSLGPERRGASHVQRRGDRGDRRGGEEQRPLRGGAREHGRGHAARRPGRRGDDRSRRRRHA